MLYIKYNIKTLNQFYKYINLNYIYKPKMTLSQTIEYETKDIKTTYTSTNKLNDYSLNYNFENSKKSSPDFFKKKLNQRMTNYYLLAELEKNNFIL